MKICRLFDSYRDGELDAARRREFERHLPDCRSCRLSLSLLSNIASALNRTEPALSPDLPERIASQAFQSRAPWDTGILACVQPKPVWLVFAVAFAILILLIVFPSSQGIDLYTEYEALYGESLWGKNVQLQSDNELLRWLEQQAGAQ
jgi:anti-sigma factor RsiW